MDVLSATAAGLLSRTTRAALGLLGASAYLLCGVAALQDGAVTTDLALLGYATAMTLGAIAVGTWLGAALSFGSAGKAAPRAGARAESLDATDEQAAARRDLEARAMALLEAIPDILLRLGRGGVVLDVRAGEQGALASTLQALIGEALDPCLTNSSPGALSAAVDAALVSGAVGTVSATLEAAGDGRCLELRIVRSGPDECMSLVRDVTQAQAIDGRLRMADRLVALGTLASGVAHEINNPLAYVTANVEYALDALGSTPGTPAPRTEDVVEALREARDGSYRIAKIVGSLKRQARHEDEPVTPVDLHQAVDAALRMLDSQLRNRAKVILSQGSIPQVMANAQQLVQVVVNLLTNAIDAFPEQAGRENVIRIATHRGNADEVALEVSDNGKGIPDGVKERIFDPFFTTKAPGVGTGLGLYLCHQFLNSFGGDIEVSSDVDRGATFKVTLRVAGSKGESVRPAKVKSVPPSRILVVDDEPLVARAIARMLSDHSVVVTDSGESALQQCRTQDFDLILCDVMMPHMDGEAFYLSLRDERPALLGRLLFVTGGAFTPQAKEFLERVPVPRMDKPIDPVALREALRSIVTRSDRPLPRRTG